MKTLTWTSILVCTISLATAGCVEPDESDTDTEESQTESADTVTVLNLPSDCALTANPPTYFEGIVTARATIACDSVHNLWVRAGIYESGGSILRTTEKTCNNTRCTVTTTWTNRAGNQTWCTRAEGDRNPTSNPTIKRACETSGF